MLLKIGNREIHCKIEYKNVRHAYMKLNPNYQLDIVLPNSGRVSAETLLKEKQNWLKRGVRELEKSVNLFDGNTVYYKGKKYDVQEIRGKNLGIEISEHFIKIYKFGKRKTENILLEFLADETLEYVSKKVEELSGKLGLFPKQVSVKNLKSFGHCTKDRKIFFNSKLICLPVRLVDYVICHELIHLKHFNHSKDFKSELAKILPNYKELEKELKKYYW
ncbi:MAG: DUF45 domain-containing protein [Candidatus Aenigmarchaeota archaeon]|nr:DUF45 domain-containing protein [Candidatus Aenigmarchaeota archaeon]